jgi:type VI secretion system protein ImpG
MDPRLVEYYERELRFVRELGAEFARRFPKLAGRLGLSELACADPHVERLLQGFAFTAGRVHMQLDAEFPLFTQQLIELIYPHQAAPTPSMAVVQFAVDPTKSSLGDGFVVERDTVLRARAATRDGTPCEFRTAHAVDLLPIELESVEYTSVLADIVELRLPSPEPIKALLRMRLRSHNMRFDRLRLDALPLFLPGSDEISARFYEQLITSANHVVMRWGSAASRDFALSSEARPVRPHGFEDEQALLPRTARSWHGYRLLQEYFAFPARFDFIELAGLAQGLARCTSDRVELLVPLTRFDPTLEGTIDRARMALFATPAINLFPLSCPRIPLAGRNRELTIVPDRTRPLDFEVHSLTRVAAHLLDSDVEHELKPHYAVRSGLEQDAELVRYTLERRPAAFAVQPRGTGSRSSYSGSELLLSLSEPSGAGRGARRHNLRQLSVDALCTNRDLPLLLSLGQGGNDFEVRSGAPIEHVCCIAGPTTPRSTPVDGDLAWRLISQLSLNYLSLCQEAGGAQAMREMLGLYAQLGEPTLARQVEGLRGISSAPVIRPLPVPGPRMFARGLEIRLDCDEQAFSGHGVFTLASVLSAFFPKYAPSNSFTETVLFTPDRGEVYRWPTQPGLRHVL